MARSNLWKILAIGLGALIFFLLVLAAFQLYQDGNTAGLVLLLLMGLGGLWGLYRYLTAGRRRREAILSRPFPGAWRDILEKEVTFYRQLDQDEKSRFERDVQLFLGEKRISGVRSEVSEELKVLVAASAVIPVFGFPDWDYPNLEEVLIYPGAFTRDFAQTGEGRNVLGMVGDGAMSRVMILSKPAVLSGFRLHNDGHNTAIHEFAHLVDAADGAYDGVPLLQDKAYAQPWLDLIHEEMERIKRKDSRLRTYGATNKAEFFAVASEYFFEKPALMKKHHPELYECLSTLFNQDLKAQMMAPLRRRSKNR